jgi:hypothetical protein
MPQRLVVVDHPVLADRLTVLRDHRTEHGAFRRALFEASAILARRASEPSRNATRKSRYGRPQSTGNWTRTRTSAPGWGTPATVSSGPPSYVVSDRPIEHRA